MALTSTTPAGMLGKRIKGEVWAVDDEMLAKLDIFEGCPTYYERTVVEVEKLASKETEEEAGKQPTSEAVSCFVYVKKTSESFLDDLESIEEYHPDPHYIPPDKRPPDWKKYYISNYQHLSDS